MRIAAVYALEGTAYWKGEIEPPADAHDLEALAQQVTANASPPPICHHCADGIEDPGLGELVAFTADDVDYRSEGGKWVRER